MKRIACIILTAAMVISMAACGSANDASETQNTQAVDQETQDVSVVENQETEPVEEASLMSVVGVYYGDLYANQKGSCYSDQNLDGFEDCIVVFDYTNDATNRTMPASNLEPGKIYGNGYTCSEVTLVVNNANSYEAYDPNGYDGHYSNAINRFTSYKNPIGYGNLLGGADTVRMYAVFYVNPNELTTESTATLTVQDQSVEFDFGNAKEITYPDEILSGEDDYETAQQIAAFKWRIDKVVELTGDVDHYMASMNPGSDLSGVGSSIGNLFSSDYGVTISGQLSAGFSSDHTFDGMNTELPLMNLESITTALPEQAGDISGLADVTNRIGEAVQDSGKSKNDVEDLLSEALEYCANLYAAFDMEVYKG